MAKKFAEHEARSQFTENQQFRKLKDNVIESSYNRELAKPIKSLRVCMWIYKSKTTYKS
jgi:hypothetical protein